MGAFLLTAGTKGKRFSMPNARIMIHQPLGGASGQAVDIEIQAKEIMYHKANLNGIMADCTGQPIERVSYLHSHLMVLSAVNAVAELLFPGDSFIITSTLCHLQEELFLSCI